MSTKNLARTAIESGKKNETKKDCRIMNRQNRRVVRQRLSMINVDDDFDELILPERTDYVMEWGDWHGNFGPLRRYLESKIGQSWNEVNSEIKRVFSRWLKTGRYNFSCCCIFDQVWQWSDPHAEYADYLVDEQGILRHGSWSVNYRAMKRDARAKNREWAERVSDWALESWRKGRQIS